MMESGTGKGLKTPAAATGAMTATQGVPQHMTAQGNATEEEKMSSVSASSCSELSTLAEAVDSSADANCQPTIDRIRQSFLRMAVRLWESETLNSQLDEYGALISPDPEAFWAKIWDSFDFSASQYIDTKLDADEQPLDVKAYLYVIGRDVFDNESWEVPHQLYFAYDIWYMPSKDGHALEVRIGAEELEGYIERGAGARRRDSLPWLDARLSRFKDKEWAIKLSYTGQWLVHTKEQDSWDYEERHMDPFKIWCLSEVFVSDVRVPLPRGILGHIHSLVRVMQSVYCEEHPVRMIAEAAFVAQKMGGRPRNDDDLRAAMLLQMIMRIAKDYRPFLRIAYDGKAPEDWDPQSTTEGYIVEFRKKAGFKHRRWNGKLVCIYGIDNAEFTV